MNDKHLQGTPESEPEFDDAGVSAPRPVQGPSHALAQAGDANPHLDYAQGAPVTPPPPPPSFPYDLADFSPGRANPFYIPAEYQEQMEKIMSEHPGAWFHYTAFIRMNDDGEYEVYMPTFAPVK